MLLLCKNVTVKTVALITARLYQNAPVHVHSDWKNYTFINKENAKNN